MAVCAFRTDCTGEGERIAYVGRPREDFSSGEEGKFAFTSHRGGKMSPEEFDAAYCSRCRCTTCEKKT